MKRGVMGDKGIMITRNTQLMFEGSTAQPLKKVEGFLLSTMAGNIASVNQDIA